MPQLIKAGQGIIASNQSANRDEEIFENPDTFNMHRKWPKEDPLGFGFGDHRCIAEHLAKAELRSAFSKQNLVFEDIFGRKESAKLTITPSVLVQEGSRFETCRPDQGYRIHTFAA